MKNEQRIVSLLVSLLVGMCATQVQAQNGRIPHTSMWLRAAGTGTQVPFAYDGAGKEYVCEWGLDMAWDNTSNQTRGANWMGRENVTVGRLSYNPTTPINDDGTLTTDQKTQLDTRIAHLKATGTTIAILNVATDDQSQMEENYTAKGPTAWFGIIKASVLYAQSKGVTFVGIMPFNESDYSDWGQGTQAELKEVARLISEDSEIGNIPVCTGSTLNCDYASSWYNCAKPYVSMGSTHQLAGDFDHYAAFFTEVAEDGNVGVMDEMHNVMEAMVGVEYGAKYGIWWGYEAMARGYFCRANRPGGARLGYAENRSAWGAASVYRLPDGQVDAFLGVSERQASTCDWEFVATDRDVYYEGYGPVRTLSVQMPGGTGYQTDDQRNAERMVRITAGADVQPFALAETDTLILMNKKSRLVMTPLGGTITSGTGIVQQGYKSSNDYQKWIVSRTSDRIGGEFGFYKMQNLKNTKMLMDLENYSETEGGQFILYPGDTTANQLYTFEYAGDGDFYILNKHSGLYLQIRNGSTLNNVRVQQAEFTGDDTQRWRLLPPEAACELTAPAAPQGLKATAQLASVRLDWTANTEADLVGYTVLRGESDGESVKWTVIGRRVEGTSFVDNGCEQGKSYYYKVKAEDLSCNLSTASDSIAASTDGMKGLVAQWQFDDNLQDLTVNEMDAVLSGSATYSSASKKSGSKSLTLDGSSEFVQLPPAVGNLREMTFCGWVYASDRTSTWQRIFDFGNSTSQYMFLTPYSGSDMRFAIKDGGDEQVLSCSRLGIGWHHVAVTMSESEVSIYVDGEQTATSSSITLRPADFTPALCYVGRSQFAADPMLKGRVDDIRIYNYALSADELKAVMDDTVNAIESVLDDAKQKGDGAIYDLSGRHLQRTPNQGIYIQNGKKILVP